MTERDGSQRKTGCCWKNKGEWILGKQKQEISHFSAIQPFERFLSYLLEREATYTLSCHWFLFLLSVCTAWFMVPALASAFFGLCFLPFSCVTFTSNSTCYKPSISAVPQDQNPTELPQSPESLKISEVHHTQLSP